MKASIFVLITTLFFFFCSMSFSAAPDSEEDLETIEDINETLGTEAKPFKMNVPGEIQMDDDSALDQPHAVKYLKETCQKNKNPKIRKVIRTRILQILKQMDGSPIKNETNNQPNDLERKKILAERKKIRIELTDTLNKDCP